MSVSGSALFAQSLASTSPRPPAISPATIASEPMDERRSGARNHPMGRLPPGATAVTYEVRFAALTFLTLTAYDTGRDVLLPIDTVIQTLGLTCSADTVARTLTIGSQTTAADPDELVSVGGTVYAALSLLTRSVRIRAHVNREDATITMSDLDAFPLARRAARQALRERERMLWERAQDEARLVVFPDAERAGVRPLPPPRWGGLVLDYAVTTRDMWAWRPDYSIGAATAFAGGSLIARTTWADGIATRTALSWMGMWPFGSQMTQLRFGEGDASGLATVATRGFSFTNAPVTRPDLFAMMPLSGMLPAHWSVDAYRDGGLVAFDSVSTMAGGFYDLPIPMRYGENPLTVVAYGPDGEQQLIRRMIRILPTMLPTRQLEYTGTGGLCVDRRCRWMSSMDLRYGVTSRLSLRAGGTEYFFRDGPTTMHPYVALSTLPLDGVSLEAEAVRHAYTRTALYLDPFPSFSVMTDYTNYSASPAAQLLSGNPGGSVWLSALRVTPARNIARGLSFDAQVWRIVDQHGVRSFARTGTAIMTGMATFRPYLRFTRDPHARASVTGSDVTLFPAVWGWTALRSYLLGGTVERTNSIGWSRTELRVTRLHGSRFTSTIGVVWDRNAPGPRLTMSLGSNLGLFRATTNASAMSAPRGPTQHVLANTISGSVRWDSHLRQITPSPDPRIDRAGVSGVLFLDRNGNGVRDAGDSALAGVLVRVNGYAVTTGRNGAYDAWGAPPMEMTTVSIDTTTLRSPWWIPTFNAAHIRVVPNTPVMLDIPIVIGGGFDGRVVFHGAARPLPASFKVTLTNVRTGATCDAKTFADGSLYQELLPPGEYQMTVDPATLDELRVTAEPVRFTITPETVTRDVQLVLRRDELQ